MKKIILFFYILVSVGFAQTYINSDGTFKPKFTIGKSGYGLKFSPKYLDSAGAVVIQSFKGDTTKYLALKGIAIGDSLHNQILVSDTLGIISKKDFSANRFRLKNIPVLDGVDPKWRLYLGLKDTIEKTPFRVDKDGNAYMSSVHILTGSHIENTVLTELGKIPLITGVNISYNTSLKRISWTTGSIVFDSVKYVIASGYADNCKYVMWNKGDNILTGYTRDNIPVADEDHFLMGYVTDQEIFTKTLFQSVIYSDLIKVNSLDAINANLGIITAGKMRDTSMTKLIDLNAKGKLPFISVAPTAGDTTFLVRANGEIAIKIYDSKTAELKDSLTDLHRKTIKNTSDITANATQIALKVNQTTYDQAVETFQNSIASNTAAIEVNANSIKNLVKADSSFTDKYNTLNNYRKTDSSAIVQNANNIALKVATATYNSNRTTDTTRIRNAEAAISAETKTRADSVTALRSAIKLKTNATDFSTLQGRVTTAEQNITSESTTRANGDNTLQSNINLKANSTRVDTLNTSLSAANALISAETTNRTKADTTEAGLRGRKDTELLSKINLKTNAASTDSLKTRMTGAELSLSSEITNRANGDNTLQSAINLRAYKTTADSLRGRISAAESNIGINADSISLVVRKRDYTGTDVVSKINQTADAVKIAAKKIQIDGTTTFTSGYNPIIAADSAKAQAQRFATASTNTLKNSLGTVAYANAISKAMLDNTIISGGYIKTSLVDSRGIIADSITGNAFRGKSYYTSASPTGYGVNITNNGEIGVHTSGTSDTWNEVHITPQNIAINQNGNTKTAILGYNDFVNVTKLSSLYQNGLIDTSANKSPTFSGITTTGNVDIGGNLILHGTIDVYNTQVLDVQDHTIELAKRAAPSDTAADGGGIRLLGTTNKTISWDRTNNNWTSSENWNLASGKSYKIDNTSLLSSTALTLPATGSVTIGEHVISRSDANLLHINNSLVAGGNIEAATHITAGNSFYLKNQFNVLNKAGNGWLPFAARNTSGSEAVYDLSNVGTLSSSGQYTNTVASGTAPMVITSPTLVSNLNADMVDGLHVGRLVYGDIGNTGSTAAPVTWDAYGPTQCRAGFWDVYGADWTPTSGWYWGLTTPHRANSSNYNYSGQQIYNISGYETYFRTIENGVANPWRRIWHDGNSNLSTVDWTAKALTLNGSLTMGTNAIASVGNVTSSGNLTVNGTGNNYFAGNVGIGTTEIGRTLTLPNIGKIGFVSINGTLKAGTGGINDYIALSGDGSTNHLIVAYGGNVGINNTAPSEKLSVSGNIWQEKNYSHYSNGYASGWGNTGYSLSTDASGVSNLTVDNLTVRKTMSVYELLIRQIRATNGNLFVSAGAKAVSGTSSTIVFEDETNQNLTPFAAGDIIVAQRFNQSGTTKLIYYVATVSGLSGLTANVAWDASGTPSDYATLEGLSFVRIGNTTDLARQGSIYLASDDDNSPYIDVRDGVSSVAGWGSSATKARLGKVDGITDVAFGGALTGFGLYSSNAYLKGKFVLASTGENIEDIFSSKATVADVDALGDTAAVHNSLIKQNAANILLKVSTTTYNNGISSLQSAINLKADTASIYTKTVSNGKFATIAGLTLTNGKFSLYASKDTIISAINGSPESITINTDRLNITGLASFFAKGDMSNVTTIDGGKITTHSLNASSIMSGGTITGCEFETGADGANNWVSIYNGGISVYQGFEPKTHTVNLTSTDLTFDGISVAKSNGTYSGMTVGTARQLSSADAMYNWTPQQITEALNGKKANWTNGYTGTINIYDSNAIVTHHMTYSNGILTGYSAN